MYERIRKLGEQLKSSCPEQAFSSLLQQLSSRDIHTDWLVLPRDWRSVFLAEYHSKSSAIW